MKPEQVKPAILVLSLSALAVGEEIKALTGGEIHGLRGRVEECDVLFDNTAHHVGQLFQAKQTIIGVLATGVLIRLVAPFIQDKLSDPAVLSVADDGSTVVPLLGGASRIEPNGPGNSGAPWRVCRRHNRRRCALWGGIR